MLTPAKKRRVTILTSPRKWRITMLTPVKKWRITMLTPAKITAQNLEENYNPQAILKVKE
jgi:hypothetical protein